MGGSKIAWKIYICFRFPLHTVAYSNRYEKETDLDSESCTNNNSKRLEAYNVSSYIPVQVWPLNGIMDGKLNTILV